MVSEEITIPTTVKSVQGPPGCSDFSRTDARLGMVLNLQHTPVSHARTTREVKHYPEEPNWIDL
jgi:hypothetical protein